MWTPCLVASGPGGSIDHHRFLHLPAQSILLDDKTKVFLAFLVITVARDGYKNQKPSSMKVGQNFQVKFRRTQITDSGTQSTDHEHN